MSASFGHLVAEHCAVRIAVQHLRLLEISQMHHQGAKWFGFRLQKEGSVNASAAVLCRSLPAMTALWYVAIRTSL